MSDVAARIDQASRLIAAPADRLFDALTDADAYIAWMPPEGMIGRIDLFEPQAGGRYRLTLFYPAADAGAGKTDAGRDTVEGRFLVVERPCRLVQSGTFESDDPAFAGTMIMTWTFVPEAGGTRVTVAASDVPPGISAVDHEAGLASTLANLARFVETPA